MYSGLLVNDSFLGILKFRWKIFNLSQIIETRQETLRDWVTGELTYQADGLGIQNSTKTTSFPGLPSSVNTQRDTVIPILVLIMLYYHPLVLDFSQNFTHPEVIVSFSFNPMPPSTLPFLGYPKDCT